VRHRMVGILLVPPGDVSGARGVRRRVQAGVQRVPVVLVEALRSARQTAWREGRSCARLAEPALDAGQTGSEGRGCRTAGHPLVDGSYDSFTKVTSICSYTSVYHKPVWELLYNFGLLFLKLGRNVR